MNRTPEQIAEEIYKAMDKVPIPSVLDARGVIEASKWFDNERIKIIANAIRAERSPDAAKDIDVLITNLMGELWDDLGNKHTTELKNFEGKLRSRLSGLLHPDAGLVENEFVKNLFYKVQKGLHPSRAMREYLERGK